MEESVYNNLEENVYPIINNKMAQPNSQQVSLRDAWDVVPLFDGTNIPLSHFIQGCYEAKAMLRTPAAQENLAWLLTSKLSEQAGKCILGSTYNIRSILTYPKRYEPRLEIWWTNRFDISVIFFWRHILLVV